MSDKNRRALPATCSLHRGPIGFANLVVSNLNGRIELDLRRRAGAR